MSGSPDRNSDIYSSFVIGFQKSSTILDFMFFKFLCYYLFFLHVALYVLNWNSRSANQTEDQGLSAHEEN